LSCPHRRLTQPFSSLSRGSNTFWCNLACIKFLDKTTYTRYVDHIGINMWWWWNEFIHGKNLKEKQVKEHKVVLDRIHMLCSNPPSLLRRFPAVTEIATSTRIWKDTSLRSTNNHIWATKRSQQIQFSLYSVHGNKSYRFWRLKLYLLPICELNFKTIWAVFTGSSRNPLVPFRGDPTPFNVTWRALNF